MPNPFTKFLFTITAIVVVVPMAVLVIGCASSQPMHPVEIDMPVVILEHADGSESWGRVLFVSEDSMSIRRMEDMQPIPVNVGDIVKAYRVERRPPNYLLAFGSSAMVLAGTWGIVVGLNGGDTSSGSFLIASAAGVVPAALVGVKVSDLTRHYRIIPMNVIGPNGRLDLRLMHLELATPAPR